MMSQECPPCPVAPTCAGLGGNLCGSGLTCPQGYENVGLSSDCSPQPCCKAGSSCGALGGDRCSDTGACPSGYNSLGRTYDCNPCCKSVGPSCGAAGGDYCANTGSCPNGYQSLGTTYDCNPCCKRGPSCGSLGGDTCKDTGGSCPNGYQFLGITYDCNPCCKYTSCGALGGTGCGVDGSCPSGYDSLGVSADCGANPCCKPHPVATCSALGGDHCGTGGLCLVGSDPLGTSTDCGVNPCCKMRPGCGDGTCDPSIGENCDNCPQDCQTCLGLCSQDTIVGACDDTLACSRYCGSCHCMAGTAPQPIECTVCTTPCAALGGECGKGAPGNECQGGVNLGVTYDCNYNACCQTVSPYSCEGLGGSVCLPGGQCSKGYTSLGATRDCKVCCKAVCNHNSQCEPQYGENCQICPQDCKCDSPDCSDGSGRCPGCDKGVCVLNIDVKSCATGCTEPQATCATLCYVDPNAPNDIVTCQDFRTRYPEQANVCCSQDVCGAAAQQAAIYCADRGGVGAISCDSARNTDAAITCANGQSCGFTCRGQNEFESGCGFFCGDGACEGAETCQNCEQDCGICPSDENGLHVLTYNIQLMAGLADCCGFCQDTPLGGIFGVTCHENEKRVPLIARHPYLKNHDVIVFEEAWSDDDRNELERLLSGQYSHWTKILNGGAPFPLLNGGVIIASKWPIVEEHDIAYGVLVFGDCASYDCFGAKGAKEAVIAKGGRTYRVFGTHTQSGYGQDVHDKWDVRQAQLRQMEQFVEGETNWAGDQPVLMAGDMNIDRNHPIVPGTALYDSFDEYQMMLAILYGVQPPIVCRSSVPNCYATNAKGNWFDYVLVHDNRESSVLPRSSSNSVIWVQDYTAPIVVDDGRVYYPNLSDHHPVFAAFEFDAPSGQQVALRASAGGPSVAAVAMRAESLAALPQDCTVLPELVAPTPTGPSGTVSVDVQRFSWQEVPGADSYHLEVSEVEGGASIRDVTIRETSFTPRPFAVSGRQYVWRVKAVRGSEQGPACADQFFTYDESDLAVPVALAPVGTVEGDSPTFAWREVPGAESYHLEVVDAATGDSALNTFVLPGSSLVPGRPLVPGREYRWKMQALRGTKVGPDSEELGFVCNSASGLEAPKPTGPVGDVEGGLPTFSWSAVAGADSYRLLVADLQTGASVLEDTVAGTTFTTPAPLSTGSRYRWHVRAQRAGVGGPDSVTVGFRCLAANQAPSVVLSGCEECQIPCSVKFTAVASDPDGDDLRYRWSGCAAGGAGTTATCSLTTPGPVVATVTVDDGRGGTATASATVVGHLPLPTVSIGDASVIEGRRWTMAKAAFTVSLSAVSDRTITLDYATANGTATAGSDYIARMGRVTFAPGETTKVVRVMVIGDDDVEPDETFFVNLGNPSPAGVVIARAQGVGTILNDDYDLSVDDVAVQEGDSGTTNAAFTVTLAPASPKPVTASYMTVNGTAMAGRDYLPSWGKLTFAPGETTKTITVAVRGNTRDEPDRTFVVRLFAVRGATVVKGRGVGTIIDDDPPPALSINDVSVSEGDWGLTRANFTVSLSATSGRVVRVHWATADGTAVAGRDYLSRRGELVFQPGETKKALAVFVLGDLRDEPDTKFSVRLFEAANATIAKAQGVGTIVDDDPLPRMPGRHR
jgi:hypothetical protein